jgi:hypothetical protein
VDHMRSSNGVSGKPLKLLGYQQIFFMVLNASCCSGPHVHVVVLLVRAASGANTCDLLIHMARGCDGVAVAVVNSGAPIE